MTLRDHLPRALVSDQLLGSKFISDFYEYVSLIRLRKLSTLSTRSTKALYKTNIMFVGMTIVGIFQSIQVKTLNMDTETASQSKTQLELFKIYYGVKIIRGTTVLGTKKP